jgi:hypothetical protein
MPWSVNHFPTWKQIAQFVSLSGAGRPERTFDTDEEVEVKGIHVLTRPSVSVVARNVVRGEVSRVNVHGRLEAGEPVKVFSTWQVMGSLAILENRLWQVVSIIGHDAWRS